MSINVTEVNIMPIRPKNGLVGFASVVFAGGLYLGSIGIHTRTDGNGYRITYPTRKVGDRSFNYYNPINRETSKLIEDAVLAKADEIFGGMADQY